jgi:Fe2+ or Zn2+ uptake regulation protein
MPSDPNIGKREREVLTAIVETFISTGEPVGSRTLSRSNREGLSPATIRNVMADLSEAGFLEQTAFLVGTRAHHRRLPLLRGADHRNGEVGAAGRNDDF